jgi:hypothetical protein
MTSKAPEKKRERERDGVWLLFFMLHKSMILSPQTKIQRIFFGLGLTAHQPSNVKENSPVNHNPSPSVFLIFSNNFYLFILKIGIFLDFFCFSDVKLNKFSFFGGNFRQIFDI